MAVPLPEKEARRGKTGGKRTLAEEPMKAVAAALILSGFIWLAGPAAAFNSAEVAAEAQAGFVQILDLWRNEQYAALYARLDHPADRGWDYFASRIVYAARVPACCWEQLQDVQSTVLNADQVVIHARVGFEVEGVGTRFVSRDFRLHRSDGVWKLPMDDVLALSDYNYQRIPREIYERQP